MDINFSCVNMEHSSYLRNYASNRFQEGAKRLLLEPAAVDMSIQRVRGTKYVSCEVVTPDGSTIFIEFNGKDVHRLINEVLDKVVSVMRRYEASVRAVREGRFTNVVELRRKRTTRNQQKIK